MSTVASPVRPNKLNWSHLYLGVALTSTATLLFELSLTRIFSVVLYYHFAFLAISIALFGLGAGGVFSYVVAGWRGSLFLKLGRLSAANSAFVIFALTAIVWRSEQLTYTRLATIYFAAALPFFLSGAILSLAGTAETVSRGVGLLVAYSAGLGLPFLLSAIALGSFLKFFKRYRPFIPTVERAAGVLLVVVGVLVITNKYILLNAWAISLTPEWLLKRL